jgi:hypothetical protein
MEASLEIAICCANAWPTDHDLLEKAKVTAPGYSKRLDELTEKTEQGMRDKDLLDHRVGQLLGLEVMVAHEWPTDTALFSMVIAKLTPEQDYVLIEELYDLWTAAAEGIIAKKRLDETIVRILAQTEPL